VLADEPSVLQITSCSSWSARSFPSWLVDWSVRRNASSCPCTWC